MNSEVKARKKIKKHSIETIIMTKINNKDKESFK